MKRLIAIMLVLLLLLNAMGFYGLLLGLRYQHRQSLTQKFETNNYHSLDTRLIKVPITLPYAIDEPNYKRIDGEFEHNGEFYRLVKQRFAQDTLYVICVKDPGSKRIHQALTDYAKTFTDKPIDSKQHGKVLSNFLKDYVMHSSVSLSMTVAGWFLQMNNTKQLQAFIASYHPSILQPPQLFKF